MGNHRPWHRRQVVGVQAVGVPVDLSGHGGDLFGSFEVVCMCQIDFNTTTGSAVFSSLLNQLLYILEMAQPRQRRGLC